MPSRDHTGPSGEGPLTGRKLGDCKNKEEQPMNTRPRLGLGRGRGAGFGRRQAWYDGRRLYRNRRFND